MNLDDVKKAIKPLGFTLNTKYVSSFERTVVTYKHVATGEKLTFNVYSPEQVERWKPLHTWVDANNEALRELGKSEGITGLRPGR